MSGVIVRIKKKFSETPTPAYKTVGSAGCDVTSSETVTIQPGSRLLVSTGLFLEVPQGYECQVRPRSGLALNFGVTVFNTPGTIDSDYRGEVKILLHNASIKSYIISTGERIAQLVFAPVTQVTFEEVEELSETDRGAGGWGSTGNK